MSSRDTTVKIFKRFALWCVLLAASTQGRSLQRIHRHRHTEEANNLAELEIKREASIRFHDDTPSNHSGRRHLEHRHTNEDTSFDEKMRSLPLLEKQEPQLRKLPSSFRRNHAIKKRHNGASDHVTYATMSDTDRANFMKRRVRGMLRVDSFDTARNERYEVEVKEAQNSSLCNYTVVDIPDTSSDKSRTPKHLVNVMCNYAGSRCRHVGNYCCIQTYSKIDVSYGNGTSETIKIYTGCVCSLRWIAELNQNTQEPNIND